MQEDARELIKGWHVAVHKVSLKEIKMVFGHQSDGEDHHVGQRTAIVKLPSSIPSSPPLCGVFPQTSSVQFYFHLNDPKGSQVLNNTAYLQLIAHRCTCARGKRAGPRMTFPV
jgi:hypothetical protein